MSVLRSWSLLHIPIIHHGLHLTVIVGGTIGTGLFIGSGGALSKSGPAGTLIGYAFVGTLVYSVMVALGEMVRISWVEHQTRHSLTRPNNF
jgi:amino acid permease